ncbi:cytadherence high molecular weight protein 2 isoform X1 [Hydra vulgaris]|uniref:cytadherence high molecular weight protein 2 isoform X1 n=1 Tax=Hydra vulgaris TaxID=6087 RepID=UPI001F5FE44B|nr:cytadherence high molecular weight protein 2 [Hydra vulgaris]
MGVGSLICYVVPAIVLGAMLYYSWSITLENADLKYKINESNLAKNYEPLSTEEINKKIEKEIKAKDQFLKEFDLMFLALNFQLEFLELRKTYQFVLKNVENVGKKYQSELGNCNKEKEELKKNVDKITADFKASEEKNDELQKKLDESNKSLEENKKNLEVSNQFSASLKVKVEELEKKIATSTPTVETKAT